MACLSKKQIRQFKIFILSTRTEAILLFIYLFTFPYILFYATNQTQNDYVVRQQIYKLYEKTGFHKIQHFDEILTYAQELLETQMLFDGDKFTNVDTAELEKDLRNPTFFQGLEDQENLISDMYQLNQAYYPVGAVRLTQYRVKKPQQCLAQETTQQGSQTNGTQSQSSQGQKVSKKNGFSPSCNPIFILGETDANEFYHLTTSPNTQEKDIINLDFSNKCLTQTGPQNCSEFRLQQANSVNIFDGQYSSYKNEGFLVDFTEDIDQNRAIMDSLRQAEWFDEFTRATILQWNLYNSWSNKYYTVTLMSESMGTAVKGHTTRGLNHVKTTLHLANTFFYKDYWEVQQEKEQDEEDKDNTMPDELPSMMNAEQLKEWERKKAQANAKLQKKVAQTRDIAMIVILFTASFVYCVKIVLELNLSISITTNSIEVLHLCVLLTALSMILVSIGIKEVHETISFTQRTVFLDLTQLEYLDSWFALLYAACAPVYPFRLLLFLARFKFSESLKHHVNILYRTLPGVLNYFFIAGLFSVSWAMGYWLQFGSRLNSMSTFLSCLAVFSSSVIVEDPEFKRSAMNNTHSQNQFMVVMAVVQYLFHIFIYSMFIALACFLYQRAVLFEAGMNIRTPDKIELLQQIDEIREQVDQIYNLNLKKRAGEMNMSASDSYWKKSKLVAWLLNQPKEVMKNQREDFFKRMNTWLADGQPGGSFERQNQQPGQNQQFESPNKLNNNNNNNNQATDRNTNGVQQLNFTGRNNGVDVGHGSNSARSRQQQRPSVPQTTSAQKNNNFDDQAGDEAEQKPIQVVPIEFERTFQLKEFLASLFQLKPRFRSTFALDKFRIVIELSSQMREYSRQTAFRGVDDVISFLSEIGCKVPVLFYSDLQLTKEQFQHLLRLKKKYIMLFITDSIDEVVNFCKMDTTIDAQ